LEYANEFRYLRTLCYPPDADLAKIRNYEEVTEKRAVQQFIDGLGGTLAERVYSRAPESVADAIKFAVHEELSPAYKHPKVVGEVRAIDSDTVCFYCKQRGHGIATCDKRRGQNRDHRETRRDGAPFMRPPTGERRTEFLQSRNQAPRTRNTNNFREELRRRTTATTNTLRADPSTVICFRCGGRGHFVNTCSTPSNLNIPRPPRQDQRGYFPNQSRSNNLNNNPPTGGIDQSENFAGTSVGQ